MFWPSFIFKINCNFLFSFSLPLPDRFDGSGTNSGVHNDSSCSSGPDSPHTSKDLHLDGSGTPTRAQYLSATCIVYTHYSGDTATVVDEHFSRALNFSNKDSKGKFSFHAHCISFFLHFCRCECIFILSIKHLATFEYLHIFCVHAGT